MKWSQTHLYTFKEAPNDADITSQQLFIRSGMIKKVAPGLFTYGPIFLRSIRKFESIIRSELEKESCIEILMPMVQPKELWEETNRWAEMGDGLLKFKNRNEQWFCLGATHEEVITDYIRFEVKSHRDLPKNIFQIQNKYRDEIRPRFGLMRGREFLMKDGYSFDLDKESALKSYWSMYEAYKRIFNKLGVEYRIVEADAGNIGGSLTHEFQLLAEAGEDALLVSSGSDFAANREICPAVSSKKQEDDLENFKELEEFPTPGLKTIEDLSKNLNKEKTKLVKTLFVSISEPKDSALKAIAILIRGDHELNLIKLKNFLKLNFEPRLLNDEEVFQLSGAHPGSCGPVGLKIPIYVDNDVLPLKNFIVGANKDGYHLKNVNVNRDFNLEARGDFRFAQEGDLDPTEPNFELRTYRGIEVGHVFYLGTKYSEKMNARYADKNQGTQLIEMGCYGIGVSRTLQAIIEQNHDSEGMIWPKSVSPFLVHICVLDVKEVALLNLAESLEKDLASQGVDVFIDDRDERPGVKFKDADLLGFPVRVTLGQKGFEKGVGEVVLRKGKIKKEVPLNQLKTSILEALEV